MTPAIFDRIAGRLRRRDMPLVQTPRRTSPWVVAACAVVAGLGIGHFATVGDDVAAPVTEAAGFSSATSPTEQIAALEATVADDPDDATAWRLLGNAYVQRGAETQDPAMATAAARSFERAGALAPGDPAVLVGKGALALTSHRFAEAEELGREAARRLPANADALGVLVDAQVELGHYDAAAETLQRMLDARPGLPALARTSYLRELSGDFDGARSAMRQAIVAGRASDHDVATVTALLGDLERRSGDLSAAGDAYADALALAPDLLAARAGAARVRAATGDLDGAMASLEAAVDEVPSPALLVVLHDLQVGSGADDDAADTAELIRAAAALQEAAGQVVDLEMAIFEADVATDPGRAVALARRAHDARPQNVFTADAMAWSLFRAGDVDGAVPFVEQALRLGTTDPALRYHAAEIMVASGRRTEAADHLAVALRDPWFSFQHRDRVLALADRLGVAAPEAS